MTISASESLEPSPYSNINAENKQILSCLSRSILSLFLAYSWLTLTLISPIPGSPHPRSPIPVPSYPWSPYPGPHYPWPPYHWSTLSLVHIPLDHPIPNPHPFTGPPYPRCTLSLVHPITGPSYPWTILSLDHLISGPSYPWPTLSLAHIITGPSYPWCTPRNYKQEHHKSSETTVKIPFAWERKTF